MSTSTVKRIVCLANSRKPGGRCIAGKEILEDGQIGRWVRPVSARPTEEVSQLERQYGKYGNGGEPQILNVIDIPVISHRPKDHQRENWLLNPRIRWSQIGQFDSNDLSGLVDADLPLWPDSLSGLSDRVPQYVTPYLRDSLRFIKVDSLRITVSPPFGSSADAAPNLRGRFQYSGQDYSLRITDPDVEARAMGLAYQDYEVGERYLTISLGEPFQGYAFKLIAGLIKA